MKAAALQDLQVLHRLTEAGHALELAGALIDEARDMSPEKQATWLRTSNTKLRGIWEELGRIMDGESPLPKASVNGDRPLALEVQDHGDAEPEVVHG